MFPLKLETYLKSHVEETMNTKYGRKGFNLITLAVDKMQMEVRTTSSFIHLHVYVRFQNVSIICSKKKNWKADKLFGTVISIIF